MPTNLYGPYDNYDLNTSHVLAALIKKIVNAKNNQLDKVEIWGTGKPKRDFIHVYDLADAIYFLTKNYSSAEPINIGSAKEISITDLAKNIAEIIGWKGNFIYNTKMPDGTLLKKLDVTKIKKWMVSKIDIKTGIKQTVSEYLKIN